jgi:hypothetical protein
MQMKSSVKRLAAVAVVGAVGILAPVASASAATTPFAPAALPLAIPHAALTGLGLPLTGLPAFTPPAFTPPPLAFVGPSIGQVAAVIGPTVITSAPSTFNNTNIQVSAGGNGSGGQAGP